LAVLFLGNASRALFGQDGKSKIYEKAEQQLSEEKRKAAEARSS